MPIKYEPSASFMDEISALSPVVYVIACVPYVIAAAAVIFAKFTNNSGDRFHTLPVMIPLAILGATALAAYVLLIGYINRDAGRRGMSRLAWTLLAVCIPNALGIVLYFVLRKPRIPRCPQCDSAVESGFGFCPRCRFNLSPVCPQCQRSVHEGDKFCPFCGKEFGGTALPPVPIPSQS
jgi:RNA polymerase subunit RPABC4/transcription elongation factor Spt4